MDYRATYNDYWRRADRKGERSSDSVAAVAAEVESCVGIGSVLDVGCGDGRLVRELSLRGFNAIGVDVSDVAVGAAEQASPGRFQVADATSLPFDDGAFDCVVSTDCLEHLAEQDVPVALAELRRVARESVYLRIATSPDRDGKWRLTVRDREWWERQCFEVGFRKHSRYFLASPFGSLDSQRDQCTIVLEPVPDAALDRYPMEALRAERDLHTDMSREPGRRSDAHNMRYYEAARRVRPGDRVLDVACGLGYGAAILAHNSRCGSYLGIDNSEYAIDYAQASFGDDRVRFETGSLPDCLQEMPEASVDFITSFETLEHLRDPLAFLAACRRVLTPGGRVMLSVPNDWTEEDGLDPNPHHFHVYDWSKVLAELEESGFHIEKTVAETVSRRKEGGEWATHGFEWRDHQVEEVGDKPGEWCIVMAMKSPFEGADAEFTNSAFGEAASDPPAPPMDFAGQYQNPWIVPALVTRGLRSERDALRRQLADETIRRSPCTADAAAALCVKAYTLLNGDAPSVEVEELLQACEPHVAPRDLSAAAPIEVRWAASLLYVTAALELRLGRRGEAARRFEQCAGVPFLRYSPLLATKTVGAAVQLASLALADRDTQRAAHWLEQGVELSRAAVSADWQTTLGDLTRQPAPAVRELAEVLELGAQCATGLSLLKYEGYGPVFLEQFRANKTSTTQMLTQSNRRLIDQHEAFVDAIDWHRQRLQEAHEAVEFWQRAAEGKVGVTGLIRRRLRRKLDRLKNSIRKRIRPTPVAEESHRKAA